MRKILLGIVGTIGLIGCGTDFGTFDGSVAGISMEVKDAIFWASDDGALNVILSGREDVCSLFQDHAEPKNTAYLYMSLYNLGADAVPEYVGPDDYPVEASMIASGKFALAQFEKTDAACEGTLTDDEGVASSGKVELTSLTVQNDGTAHGRFDLDFGDDEATGSFDAVYCDIPTNNDPNDNDCQ